MFTLFVGKKKTKKKELPHQERPIRNWFSLMTFAGLS